MGRDARWGTGRAVLGLLLVVGLSASAAAEGRAIAGTVKVDGKWIKQEDVDRIGDYHALIIAIDKYGPAEWRLRTPVSDGKALAKVLREQYGFRQIVELYDEDATMTAIRRAFVRLGRRVGKGDSVLIYFAGHGLLEGGTGFWVPANGKPGEIWNFIESVTIRDMIKMERFHAKHVLIVSDSCYSAALFRDVKLPASDVVPEYVRRALRLPARQLLTSGGMKPVADGGGGGHSVFAKYFLKCLEHPPRDVFVPSDLMADLKFNVGQNAPPVGGERQVPILGVLEQTGAERGGEFVFIRRRAVAGPDSSARLATLVGSPRTNPEVNVPARIEPDAPAWAKVSKEQRACAARLGLPVAMELDLGKAVRMHFVLIPPGTFTMGSRNGGGDESPPRLVRITKAFYAGVFEVTQAQYAAVMGRDPSSFAGADHPVETVSWTDARGFCEKLAATTRVPVTLSTEAQWEYLCRAGTRTRYSFGDDGKDLSRYGWAVGGSDGRHHPVGARLPNAWGLYDVHGNVGEWCLDWYGANDYQQQAGDDPGGPETGATRVWRGGSWASLETRTTSSYRDSFAPDRKVDYVGFRVVFEAKAP